MSEDDDGRELGLPDVERALRGRLVWDVVPDEKITGWAEKLGLHAYSPEVAEMEQMQALRRRLELAPIAEEFALISLLTADILRGAMLLDRAEKGQGSTLDLQDTEEVAAFLLAGVTAVVANLVDMERLTIPDDWEEGEES